MIATILLALSAFSAATLTACDNDRPVPPVSESRIRERTAPSDAQSVSSSSAARTPYPVDTTWEFTTGMSWSDYLAWVKPQLLGFMLRRESAVAATFVRLDGGDSYTLVIEPVTLEPMLRIRLTWHAGPA